MDCPEIIRHAVKDGVTSAGHQLPLDGRHGLLIDCGLFQGAKTSGRDRSGARHPPPIPHEHADKRELESTYSNRIHEGRQTRHQRLQKAMEQVLQGRGTVLICASSIGCSQELLCELEEIFHDCLSGTGSCWSGASSRTELGTNETQSPADRPTFPIILASPFACRFTEVYRELQHYRDDEARDRLGEGRKPLAFDLLLTIDSHEDRLKTVRYLAETTRPAVAIACSIMCNADRIVNYLKAMLGERCHDVLFVGYKAPRTAGHSIRGYG